MPTTGFAIAVWLAEKMLHANVCLCGFTGVAGLQFSMYTEHDWTFEQIMLQLFVKKGRIRRFEEKLGEPAGSFARIHSRFPEFSEATTALVANNVAGRQYNLTLSSQFRGFQCPNFLKRLKKPRMLRSSFVFDQSLATCRSMPVKRLASSTVANIARCLAAVSCRQEDNAKRPHCFQRGLPEFR